MRRWTLCRLAVAWLVCLPSLGLLDRSGSEPAALGQAPRYSCVRQARTHAGSASVPVLSQ